MTAERFTPPPEHACKVDEQPIELGVDPDTGGRHILYRLAWWYWNYVVFFSLQQIVEGPHGRATICRIDTKHGTVHRHVFTRSQGHIEPPVELVVLSPRNYAAVDAAHDRYLDELLDNWEARYRTWSRS